MLKLVAETKSASLRKALEAALKNDNRLDDKDVRKLIRSTFDENEITTQELQDLARIALGSKSMSQKSKRLVAEFCKFVKKFNTLFKKPALQTVKADGELEEKVFEWMEKPGNGAWPHLRRYEIGLGLIANLRDPGQINQGETPNCVVASLLYSRAKADRQEYANFVKRLYDTGKGMLGGLEIDTYEDVRNHNPDPVDPDTYRQVDWMTMAAIRNSDAGFFTWLFGDDYHKISDEGGITPSELRKWLEDIGYKKIVEAKIEKATPVEERLAIAQHMNHLWNDYWIFMRVDSDGMFDDPWKASAEPNHRVVLTSRIVGLEGGLEGDVSFKVFTWGKGDRQVDLPTKQFLAHFYGYAAATH